MKLTSLAIPDAVKEPLGRRLPRLDPAVGQLLAGFLVRYRLRSVGYLASSLMVGLLEGASMLVLALVIQVSLLPDPAALLAQPGRFAAAARAMHGWLGPGTLAPALLGIVVLLQLLRCACGFAEGVLATSLTTAMLAELRTALHRRFLSMSFPEFNRQKLGEMLSHFDQVEQVGSMIRLGMELATQLTIALIFVAILFWLSWPLTIIAVLVILLLFGPLLALLSRVRQTGLQMYHARLRLSQRVAEVLQGFRLVQMFGLHRRVEGQFAAALGEHLAACQRGGVLQSAVQPVFESMSYLAGLGIFLLGYLVFSHAAGGMAGVLAYTLTLYRLVPRVTQINQNLPRLNTHWPTLCNIARLALPAETMPVSAPVAAVPDWWTGIHFRNVSFRYEGTDTDAVADLCFTIPRGRMTALVGSSGAGKTTILHLLLGFYRPTAGQIELDGVNLAEVDPDAWRATIGVVDQEGFLFHASVRDNIAMGNLAASDDDIRQAARLAGADDFIMALPDGYATPVGDRGQRLSGGQRQRLAIARALLRDPQLLILDEATSQLDNQSEHLIREVLESAVSDRTIVCITHRLANAAAADQILVFDQGRLVESGTHRELLARDSAYARLWRLQSGESAAD